MNEPDESTAELFVRVLAATDPMYPQRVDHALGVVATLAGDQQRALLESVVHRPPTKEAR